MLGEGADGAEELLISSVDSLGIALFRVFSGENPKELCHLLLPFSIAFCFLGMRSGVEENGLVHGRPLQLFKL